MSNDIFYVACVQNCADDNIDKNISEADALVRAAQQAGAQLICLPEYFAFIGANDLLLLNGAYSEQEHPALAHFQLLAKELNIWLLLGSLAIKLPTGKVNNRSYMLNPEGQIIAHYNKIHLFDVSLDSGEKYAESSTVEPGNRAVLADTPWGKLGMSICYDLRFAYLFRRLAQNGAAFLAVPAAFTRTTGQAHWHALLRSRAIETGSYMFAPGQCGIRNSGRATFGHSLIVDPWGIVLADGGDLPGFIMAKIEPERVREARRMIPALEHDREFGGP
jgi:deaminated glutathione amidase